MAGYEVNFIPGTSLHSYGIGIGIGGEESVAAFLILDALCVAATLFRTRSRVSAPVGKSAPCK